MEESHPARPDPTRGFAAAAIVLRGLKPALPLSALTPHANQFPIA